MPVKLLLAVFLAAYCSVDGAIAFAETPEDVKQRMELYRQREEEAETKKAERAAEDAARRQKTRLWQEARRAEEYARTWKRYGSDEVNVLSWRQHKDGSWVADAKLAFRAQEATAKSPVCIPASSFRCQLEALARGPSAQTVRNYAITPERRAFLNLIRYLVLTWEGGEDSGYLLRNIVEKGAIGAYQIKAKMYEQALLEYWGPAGNKKNESFAPRAYDQVALHLLRTRSGALKHIDKAYASEEELNITLAAVAHLFPVQAGGNNKAKTAAVRGEAFAFYSDNIARLRGMNELITIVRFGDTVVKIAQRYGLTLQELLQLNPGIETARLVVGSQVRLAQAAPGRTRMVLGLKPTTSGGVSWPELPGFGEPNKPFEGPSSSQDWIWPTQGVFISGYGWREGKMHYGIDVANKVGTPIVAAKSGQVVFSGWHDGGYGYLVTLAHADGSRSLYAHNSRLMVQIGENVEQGSLISLMGSSGQSQDSYLHFEIHPPAAGAVNPLQFLPGKATALDPADLGVGQAKGQDQHSPALSPLPVAAGTNPQPAISMQPAPKLLNQRQRPEPAARPPARFGSSLDELVRSGLVSPEERAKIRTSSGMKSSVSAVQQACASGALSQPECTSGLVPRWRGKTTISGPTIKQLSPNEQALLQRIRSNSGGNVPKLIGVVQVPGQSGTAIFQLGDISTSAAVGETIGSSGWRLRSASGDMAVIEKSGEQRWCDIGSSSCHTRQWRTYGQCKYDWAGWKLHSNGTRTTAVECGGSAMRLTVGVSCDRLLVAAHTTASGWSKWKAPAGPGNKSRQGEDEMVAALCANV